jgi:hypothetical protein
VPPARASNATPSELSSRDIQGTYFNEAYGPLTLCSVAASAPNGIVESINECDETLAKHPFDVSSDITDSGSHPTLIARFGKTSTAYLLFRHKNESSFIVSMGMNFPQTNAQMPSIYGYWDAIFSREGMAFAGNAWGAGIGVEPSDPWAEGGPKQNAEVWFDKVVEE